MNYIKNLIERRPYLSYLESSLNNAYYELYECFKNNNKLLICGNGGSCADSGHITGELMKRFNKERRMPEDIKIEIKKVLEKIPTLCINGVSEKYEEMLSVLEMGLKTVDLTAFTALNTAFINDKDANYMYANEVLTLGEEGDVLLCITTSGNSKNVVNAAVVAKAKKLKVISLTGKDGGVIKSLSDAAIVVNNNETYQIQEEHLAIYHTLCLELENNLF